MSRLLKILVVEDDPVQYDALAELLRQDGHVVAQAANGYGALTVLGVGPPPDLVTLDLVMPGMNGAEFLRALRALPKDKGKNVPVLVLTAACEEVLAEVAKLPKVRIIRKPVDPHFIQAAIRSMARRQQTSDSWYGETASPDEKGQAC